ncbi:MAG: aldo/keto reductase [Acidimicrobiales bacterium]
MSGPSRSWSCWWTCRSRRSGPRSCRHRSRAAPGVKRCVITSSHTPPATAAPTARSLWLDPGEPRIGLGCMRLPSPERVAETVAAAVAAGTTVFDTARAYGPNERWLAAALKARDAGKGRGGVRVVTKGGMARPDGAWRPDGRARAIRADCEASLDALDGLPIDLYLLHAPDPRVPLRTSLRALAALAREGLVARVGVCNVNLAQLEEALGEAPIAAVQIGLSLFDDHLERSGLLQRCEQAGITVMAHSPLGGPGRAARLCRRPELVAIGAGRGCGGGEVALRWLLDLSPNVVAIPGCTRPETIRSAMASTSVPLPIAERDTLRRAFRWPAVGTVEARATATGHRAAGEGGAAVAEVVVIMGIPGAGKTQAATALTEAGHLRLNRDERGGSLRGVVDALDHALGSGTNRLVLDNTYLTRAARNEVIEVARRHDATIHCRWLDTPLAQAQINLTHRMLDTLAAAVPQDVPYVPYGMLRMGTMPVLPDAAALRALAPRQPGLLSPSSQMRAQRQLEPPQHDEGFDTITRVPFARERPDDSAGSDGSDRPALLIAAAALDQPGGAEQASTLLSEGSGPVLLFGWDPDGDGGEVRTKASLLVAPEGTVVVTAHCAHPGGPPSCWCRPPLPGLALAFARTHAVNLVAATVVGIGPAHRSMAAALGATYVQL